MIIFFKLGLLFMNLSKNFKEHWLITLILIIGVVFRFVPIAQYQFSHDELSGLSRTIFVNLADELNYGVKIDTHPALIQVFLWIWVKLFGYSEIAIKLPFLICGALSIWYAYKFGKTFLSKKAGLVAATILSCSFIFLVYSSYARMYISGVLFSILFLHTIFKLLFFEEINTKDYILFTLFALLCAYNHHMSCLFALTLSLLSLFYIKKERVFKFVAFGALTLVLYLPHLSITLYQFSNGNIGATSGGWLSAPRMFEVYYFIKTLFGCGISGKMILLLFLGLTLSSIFKLLPISKKQFLLLWIFLINYLIIHLYSVYRNPILQNSVLLFSGLCLIFFLSSFVNVLSKKLVSVFCFSLMLLLSYQTIRKKHFFSKVNDHGFETQARSLIQMQNRVGENNVTAIFGSEPFFIYAYEKKYHTKLPHVSVYDSLFINHARFSQYLQNLKQPYIVLSGVGAMDILRIKEYYPYLVSNTDDYFSNVTVLSKYDHGNYDVSILNTMPLFNSDINIYLPKNKSIQFCNDSLNYIIEKMDSNYPFNLSIPVNKALVKKHQFLVAELSYKVDSVSQISADKLCVTVSKHNEDPRHFTSANLYDYYDGRKKIQKTYAGIFAGEEFESHISKDITANFFIWKAKESHYKLVDFKLKQVDYNPTKWTIWD